jgi:hypothetical protein
MSLCGPSLLYLIIGIISIVMMIYSKTDMKTVAMKGLFIAIWTWFLNFLCSKGHEGISWFLVILPFVVMALAVLAMSNIIGGKITKNKEMFSNCDSTYCSTTNNQSCCCADYPNSVGCCTSYPSSDSTYCSTTNNKSCCCADYPHSVGCCTSYPSSGGCIQI